MRNRRHKLVAHPIDLAFLGHILHDHEVAQYPPAARLDAGEGNAQYLHDRKIELSLAVDRLIRALLHLGNHIIIMEPRHRAHRIACEIMLAIEPEQALCKEICHDDLIVGIAHDHALVQTRQQGREAKLLTLDLVLRLLRLLAALVEIVHQLLYHARVVRHPHDGARVPDCIVHD